ncbi:MAG: S-layer homology domain-containing protein [Bacillota bacterium]|nr:S-layer homology domain-containing protein [Bacillota bacterium]
MINAKKLISIIVAIALSLSLMTNIFAFSDVEKTDAHSDAIGLLTSLSIIGGYDDGTFKPNAEISREEFAKLVYVLMNGSSNASYFNGKTRFYDVAAGRWSAGYVNWAYEMGIVGGYPDGGFHPTDKVTLAEVSKMLDTALGFNGLSFPYGYISKASLLKLFENVTQVGPDTKATRGTVAEMIKNSLFALNVPAFMIYDGNGKIAASRTAAEAVFGIKDAVMTLEGTSTALGTSSINEAGEVYLTGDVGSGTYLFDGRVDNLLMHNVNVWYKDTDNNGTLSAADEIKGITEGINTTVSYTTSDVYQKINDTNFYVKNTDGSEVNLFDGSLPSKIIVNGKTAASFKLDMLKKNDTEITLINNNSISGYDVAVINERVNDIISSVDYNQKRVVTLTTGYKNFTDRDGNTLVNISEGLNAQDHVIVTSSSSYFGKTYNIEKADYVENVVFNKRGTEKYTLGGKLYYIASDATTPAPSQVGEEYDLALDTKGNIVSAVLSDERALDNFALIKDVNIEGLLTKTFTATIVLPTGEEKTLKMDKTFSDGKYFDGARGWLTNDGKAYGESGFSYDNIAVIGKAFSIDMSYVLSNTISSIKDLANSKGIAVGGGNGTYDSSTGALSINGKVTGFANNNTILYVRKIVLGESVIEAYNGKDIPSFGSTNVSEILIDNTDLSATAPMIKIMVADELAPNLLEDNNGYGIMIEKSLVAGSQRGKYYYEMSMAIGGQLVTITTDENTAEQLLPGYGIADNTFVKVELTNDGKAGTVTEQTAGTSADFHEGYIKSASSIGYYNFASFDYNNDGASGAKITNVQDNYYKLTSDAKIYTMTGSPIVNGAITTAPQGEAAIGSKTDLIAGNQYVNYVVIYHVVPAGDEMGMVDTVFVYQLPIEG